MKQFIYLDTDIVNSIIAQKDKGLVIESTHEKEDAAGTEHRKSGSAALNGSVGGSLMKLVQAQAELSGTGEISIGNDTHTVLKEMVTKTLHDAAFDIAYEQIKSQYSMDPQDADLGAYIELTQAFEFVDFKYIEGLFAEKGFIDFLKKTQRDKIEQQASQSISEGLTREQRRGNEAELKRRVRTLCSDSDKKFDQIAETITAMRCIIPYDRMLVSSDGYVIPLEDKYFRDNPQTMGFKHGGYVTCVGYITNVIGETAMTMSGNVFSQLQNIVNKALVEILSTKEKDLFVVHPIAIFCGKS